MGLYLKLFIFLLLLPIAQAHTTYRMPMRCTGSMEPSFECEDKIYVNVVFANEHPLKVDEIICFNFDRRYYPASGIVRYLCHRIVDVVEDGYITKGDACLNEDPYVVPFSWVALKVVEIRKI